MDERDDYLAALTDRIRAFTTARNWGQFHTPKNLAMALAGEAGELVAEFQWLTPEQSHRHAMSAEKLAAVESEMADVLIYLVQLAGVLEVDLPDAVDAKMAINTERFPVPDQT